MTTAKNIITNEIKSIPKELYQSSDEWVSLTKNLVVVKDITTDEIKSVTLEDFYSQENLIHINKNMTQCFNINTGEKFRVTTDEFNSNPELVGSSYGKRGFKHSKESKFLMSIKSIANSKVRGLFGKDNPNFGSKRKQECKDKISLKAKGLVTAFDLTNGKNVKVTKEVFDSNSNLVGIANKKVKQWKLDNPSNQI